MFNKAPSLPLPAHRKEALRLCLAVIPDENKIEKLQQLGERIEQQMLEKATSEV
jgi:hypothetical protein